MRRPRVGERRVYTTGDADVLYPGEWAQVDEHGLCTVEPEPGLGAWWRRMKYRLFGPVAEWLQAWRQRNG